MSENVPLDKLLLYLYFSISSVTVYNQCSFAELLLILGRDQLTKCLPVLKILKQG